MTQESYLQNPQTFYTYMHGYEAWVQLCLTTLMFEVRQQVKTLILYIVTL